MFTFRLLVMCNVLCSVCELEFESNWNLCMLFKRTSCLTKLPLKVGMHVFHGQTQILSLKSKLLPWRTWWNYE